MTITGISSAQPARPVAFALPAHGTGGRLGKSRTRATIEQITMKPAASSRPGTMPAMNSFTTDCCASCAYTTIGMDGGMIGPSSAPAAITAPAKPSP